MNNYYCLYNEYNAKLTGEILAFRYIRGNEAKSDIDNIILDFLKKYNCDMENFFYPKLLQIREKNS